MAMAMAMAGWFSQAAWPETSTVTVSEKPGKAVLSARILTATAVLSSRVTGPEKSMATARNRNTEDMKR